MTTKRLQDMVDRTFAITDHDKRLTQAILDQYDEAEGKPQCWKIMWFLKDGRSFFGEKSFSSYESALAAGAMAFARDVLKDSDWFMSDADHRKVGAVPRTIRNKMCSHIIPMPIGDE